MTETRYTEADHERAFKLWRQGKSYRAISQEDGLPSRETIRRWADPDFDCKYNCKWHGYRELNNEIVKNAMEEVEKDLPDPVDREKKRLKFLYETERQLNEMIESGELEAPRTLKSAVELLESIYNQQRLIRGESTSIVENRGSDHKELNLQKVMNQLNVGDTEVSEDELIEAVEEEVSNVEG